MSEESLEFWFSAFNTSFLLQDDAMDTETLKCEIFGKALRRDE